MTLVMVLWITVLLCELARPGFYDQMARPVWLVTVLITVGEVVIGSVQQTHERELKRLEFEGDEDEPPAPKISAG